MTWGQTFWMLGIVIVFGAIGGYVFWHVMRSLGGLCPAQRAASRAPCRARRALCLTLFTLLESGLRAG
jgi:hypothetical protein